MATHTFILIVAYIIVVPYVKFSKAAESLRLSESITDGNTLVSQGGIFELGIFSPGKSKNRYLGIWYKNIPVQTVVWVANRENPINGSSGMLKVNNRTGNIVLSQNGSVVWHTNFEKQAKYPEVVLLASGNLVVRNEGDANTENYLWQSFDFPSDTSLPKMRLGRNTKLGFDWRLTSWKSPDDPSLGIYSWGVELYNYPEYYLMKGTEKFYRIGPWNGMHFSGLPNQNNNSIYNFSFVSNKDEVYYSYSLKNNSVISIIMLNQSNFYRYVWVTGDKNWRVYKSQPIDFCDTYGLCGAYGSCMISQTQVCQCLKGFSPKSPQAWISSDWSQGCVRNKPLSCNGKDKDGFVKFEKLKLPDTTHTWLDESIGLEECKVNCLNNCSCMAYANSDIRGAGRGCAMWFGDLIDMKQFQTDGQDLYIRMSASDLEVGTIENSHKKNIRTIVGATVASICGVLLLCTYLVCRVGRNTTERIPEQVEDLDLPLFNLQAIAIATNDFSDDKKLGEGGFGPVYWGKSVDGQQIAVKRLSSFSGQGRTEFINEVKLIAKLQHRNLVKLLGCCIQRQEQILVYEYMANSSLDYFIFDDNKGKLLDWPQRFHIIYGVARGLTYLHQDSRLRIVHRDLKASNVLLDDSLNPKISDFGMARTFGGDQTEGNTNRIVGNGYMAPEYAVDGLFSVKSDVFSLGILLLEVICGKRNKAYYYTDTTLNLVGQAWRMWKEDRALELIDSNLGDSYVVSEVLRCIHVSLLCVQQHPDDRPTMDSVILMLGSEMELVEPKEPGFISKNVSSELGLRTNQTDQSQMTISLLDPR